MWARAPGCCYPLGGRKSNSPLRTFGAISGSKGSAACTGRADVGEIAVGMLADLAPFKLDELRFSRSGDPLAALVLCGAHRADRVMVGGRWIVENGQIPRLDVADLIRRHSAAARKLQAERWPYLPLPMGERFSRASNARPPDG